MRWGVVGDRPRLRPVAGGCETGREFTLKPPHPASGTVPAGRPRGPSVHTRGDACQGTTSLSVSSPIRGITVALLFTVSGVSFADRPALALGYQFLPLVPIGLSLSLLDTFGFLGLEATLGAGGSRSDQERTNRFSASLGVNFATPIDLYPGFAINAVHTRRTRGDTLIQRRTVWGVDTKLTFILFAPVGITVGYRAPFEAPLRGSLILGMSLILLRQAPTTKA